MNQMNTATRLESNNAAQDDEQHNTTLRWRNHEKKHKRKILIYMCENHLFKSKEKGKKICRGVILGQKMM